MFVDRSKSVVAMIDDSKLAYYRNKFLLAKSKETFKLADDLLCSDHETTLPAAAFKLYGLHELAESFANYFEKKVAKMRYNLDALAVGDSPQS